MLSGEIPALSISKGECFREPRYVRKAFTRREASEGLGILVRDIRSLHTELFGIGSRSRRLSCLGRLSILLRLIRLRLLRLRGVCFVGDGFVRLALQELFLLACLVGLGIGHVAEHLHPPEK